MQYFSGYVERSFHDWLESVALCSVLCICLHDLELYFLDPFITMCNRCATEKTRIIVRVVEHCENRKFPKESTKS